MERPVKERLVGAAVLMAAAIILIPEMLSGPDRESVGRGGSRDEGAIKTYTIDLNQPPGSTAPTATLQSDDNRAPPPEEVAPPQTAAAPAPDEPQASPESVASTTPAERTPAPSPQRDSPPVVVETPPPTPAPTRAAAPPPKAETRPVASAPAAPTSPVRAASGWAVQVGSYSSEATAGRLVNEWLAKGQPAFVMPVKSGGKTLYRVRIGPAKDRADAEAVLRTIKASAPGAAVVSHP